MAYKKFTEDYIREHWEEALDSRMTYYDIARKIRWGLSRDDLGELAWLHEGGKHRRKIEALLTDCNFHYECGKFMRGEYAAALEENA